MAKKTYSITEKAGRYVAGVRNTGLGTTLRLTDKEAEAGLRDGTLVLVSDEAPKDSPFAVATVTGTSTSPKAEVDTVPQASEPEAPARPAGSATTEEAVRVQREAEAASTEAEGDQTARDRRAERQAAKAATSDK